MQTTFDKLMKLDTFTRNQIVNEFENTLFIKPVLNTESIEHFESRKFDLNQFYGAFLLVIAILAIVSYIA